jgi:hypothetical protein
VTRRQNPTGSQRQVTLLQVETSSETILLFSIAVILDSQAIHRRCSVSRPGARQNEHAPLFEQLLQSVLVASTK